MDELELDERDIARALSVARAGIGAFCLLFPRKAVRYWTGEESGASPTSTMAVRGMGARDLAIGMATLDALENDGPVADWLRAGAIADASDAWGVLTSYGRLPKFRRLFLLASAGGAAWLGWRAAGELSG